MNPTEYVRQTCELVRSIETRFLELGARIFKIKTEELWRGTHESFQDFLAEAKITPTLASMLTSVHKHYVLEGQVDEATLAKVGYSPLYEAIPFIEKHGMDKTMAMVTTLSRQEIIEEKREAIDCQHSELITICSKCHKRIDHGNE